MKNSSRDETSTAGRSGSPSLETGVSCRIKVPSSAFLEFTRRRPRCRHYQRFYDKLDERIGATSPALLDFAARCSRWVTTVTSSFRLPRLSVRGHHDRSDMSTRPCRSGLIADRLFYVSLRTSTQQIKAWARPHSDVRTPPANATRSFPVAVAGIVKKP